MRFNLDFHILVVISSLDNLVGHKPVQVWIEVNISSCFRRPCDTETLETTLEEVMWCQGLITTAPFPYSLVPSNFCMYYIFLQSFDYEIINCGKLNRIIQ